MTTNNTPQTPEAVAYQLMKDIFIIERKIVQQFQADSKITKQELLNTYRECLLVTKS